MLNRKAEGTQNKLNPVVILSVIVALIVIAIVISPFVKSAIRNNKFASAVSLVEKGEYDEAAAMFAEIKDYKEVEIAEYCKESLVQFCNDKEFQQAWDWVFALSYQELVPDIEVMDMYDRIKYYQAAGLVDSGDYLEAYEKYVALGDYLDSAEKAESVWQDHKDVFYDLALSRYNSENLSSIELAKQEFEKLGDYADSQKYLAEATFITSMCGTYDTGSGDRCVIEVGKLTSYDGYDSKYSYKLVLSEYNGEMCLFADYKNSMGAIYVLRNGEVYWNLVDVYENGSFSLYTSKYSSGFHHIEKISNSISEIKKPAIGMTAEEVKASTWGEPKKINKTTYSWGVSEQWVYSTSRYIYLENGIVTAIQE